jgi:hypothetical protein
MIVFTVYDGKKFVKRFSNIKEAKAFVGDDHPTWHIRIEMCEACNE